MKTSVKKIILILIIIVAGFLIRTNLEILYQNQKVEEKQSSPKENDSTVGRADQMDYAENVGEDNFILQTYLKEYPETKVLLACEEDITNDDLKDLIIIYRDGDYSYATVAVDSGDGENYSFTEPILAPYENHKIQFKNIDKEAEMEFVLMGERNGVTGYGIFRMVEGAPVNLFGEGMEDC